MPNISVIIPCYNSYHLMNRCLDALENQTYCDFEIIIIDDCSMDDSYIKLLQYQKQSNLNLKIFKNDKNLGPGLSRNRAIAKATGKYVAFCDSDDWYEHNYLEEMLKRLEKTNSNLCICNYTKIFDNGNKETINYTKIFNDYSTVNEYIAYSKVSFCLMLIAKELFNDISIPDLRNGEDMAIIPVLLSKCNKIAYSNLPLYNYYIRSDSASNMVSEKVYMSLQSAYEYCYTNIDKEKYYKELEFIGIKYILYGVSLNYLKVNKDIKELKKIIIDFQRKFPRWYKNSYLKKYNFKYRIYVKSLRLKIYGLCKLYAEIHQIYTKQ